MRSISEKAPLVLVRVALKNIVLPRALSTLPWPARKTVASFLIRTSVFYWRPLCADSQIRNSKHEIRNNTATKRTQI